MDKPRIRYARLTGPSEKEVEAAKTIVAGRAQADKRRKASARVQCARYGLSPGSPIADPCGRWFAIADAVFVDMRYWDPPSGCSGGGYWRSGEGSFTCPHCGYLNRAYGREEIDTLSAYFARRVTARQDTAGGLRFEGEYPYPAHVKARIVADALKLEAKRLVEQAASLRGQIKGRA